MRRPQKTASQPPQWPLVSRPSRYIPIPSHSSILHLSHTAPSAAPTSVNVSAVTSSSITVQWEAVDCIHRNGDITGYSVRYGEEGSGSTQTVNTTVTEATIHGLMSFTNYSIQVAAENSAGSGDYTDPITVETRQSKLLVYRLHAESHYHISLN